jgi:hypothetical protein
VNNYNAISNGGLEGNASFFGSATAEILSSNRVVVASIAGGWHGDRSESVQSSLPWAGRGLRSFNTDQTGLFAFTRNTGEATEYVSHRTILSGY